MMHLYEIDEGSYQRHFVVAPTMGEAEATWIAKYNSTPTSITDLGPYVLIAKGAKPGP